MAIEPTSSSSAQQADVENPIQQLKAAQGTTEEQPQQQQVENTNGNGNGNAEVDGLENQSNNININTNNLSELHSACAEGKLDQVRNVLSRGGFESLESLDVNTGCTPIVLAIRGNHHDVVRELLSAGAIVPPPGLTNDPLMNSILYPQPMYGIPPQFMGIPPQEFYQQTGFYPDAQQQQRGMFVPPPPPHPSHHQQQSQAIPNGIPNNLPPAEVSKTIPCRNFPNCKYGASCVFFHPRNLQQQQPSQPFYPSGPSSNGNFIPQGYEHGYPASAGAPYQPAQAPYFIPNNQAFIPNQVEQQQQQQSPASDIPQQHESQQQQQQTESINNNTQHDQSLPVQVPQHQQHVPSAIAPIFVPGFQQPQPQIPTEMMSPPLQSQFGMSPISPSMLGTSLPTIPPAEAFFAAASPPPNGFMPPLPPVALNGPAAVAHARRQSFNQQQQQQFGGNQGKPFGHGKKPSFSGAPKPWMGRQSAPSAGSAKLGSWKDGNPPPCAFFNQGNCRNGEFCKFPHLDAEGNDSRHPDVVRGVLPPIPSFTRPPRGMRMMGGPGFNGPVDPSFRQQQHQQQIQFLQHQRMAAAQAQQGLNASSAPTTDGESNTAKSESTPAVEGQTTASDAAEKTESASAVPSVTVDGEASTPAQETNTNLPAKPAAVNGTAPLANMNRSASQPGVQRVHVNGNNSRSHSPAPSNVSFHGNGHPRRAGSRVPPQLNGHGHGHVSGNYVNGHGSRSSSAGEKKGPSNPLQRVPQAHEFPALGLGSATTTPTSEKKESTWGGKTAAQVLSAPAPPKPEPVQVKVTDTEANGEGSDSEKSGKANSITMDSDSESDAVIISTKASTAAQSGQASPAPSAPTPSAPAVEIKKAPISFASAVGVAGIAPIETAPVALKA